MLLAVLTVAQLVINLLLLMRLKFSYRWCKDHLLVPILSNLFHSTPPTVQYMPRSVKKCSYINNNSNNNNNNNNNPIKCICQPAS